MLLNAAGYALIIADSTVFRIAEAAEQSAAAVQSLLGKGERFFALTVHSPMRSHRPQLNALSSRLDRNSSM